MNLLYLINFFLLLLLLPAATQIPCSENWECSSSGVTTQFNFAHCDGGFCVCHNEWGFVGNATESNPCSCEEPSQVLWNPVTVNPSCVTCLSPKEIIYDRNGIPRCIDPEACEEVELDLSHQEEVVRTLFENLIYPNPTSFLNNTGLASNIFDSNVRGRITPLGTFPTFNSTVHFFFALAATPDSRVVAVNFVQLSSSKNVVSIQVDVTFNRTADTGLKNLTQVGFFYFNANGLIETFDLTILRLGLFNPLSASDEVAYRYTICQIAEYYCPITSPYGQYNDSSECIDQLTSIPLGTWDAVESNTLVCRLLSSVLVPLNPSRHCKSIGPSGGQRCVDKPYEAFYAQNYSTSSGRS